MVLEEPPTPPEPPEALGLRGLCGSASTPRVVRYFSIPSSPTVSGDIFQVPFSARSTHRAASFPGRMGPSPRHVFVLLMFFTYLVGGAPRAALSPSCSGLTQWCLLSPHLSEWICSFMLNLLDLIACSIDTYLWSRSLWHDTYARVRPYKHRKI